MESAARKNITAPGTFLPSATLQVYETLEWSRTREALGVP